MSGAEAARTQGSDIAHRLHGVSFLVAFIGFAIVQAGSEGSMFLGLCGAIALCAVPGLMLPRLVPAVRLAMLAVGAAALMVLAFPLGRDLIGGESLPALAKASFLWPQILTLLFASRLASDWSQARVAQYWRAPLSLPAGTSAQSLAAALLLGAALVLSAYHLVPDASGFGSPVAVAIFNALHGTSLLHIAIMLLFGVFLAALIDAARVHIGDLMVLRALARRGAASVRRADLVAFFELDGAVRGRASRVMARQLLGDDGRFGALDSFDDAARSFLRGLLPVLPLLGFLGTVIGLALAVSDLQGAIDVDGGPSALARVLSGLSVKFETTLLGLLFSIAGGLLLALLEKSEAQANAAATFLAQHLGASSDG